MAYTTFKYRFIPVIKQYFLGRVFDGIDFHDAFNVSHIDFGSECETKVLIDVEG